MTHSYIIDLTIDLAMLMIACAVVFSCAIIMLQLRKGVITLLVIAIVGVSGCLWSLL